MKNYISESAKHTNTLTKIVALTIVFFFVFYGFDLFFDRYDARSPIIFQSPIIKRYEDRLKVEPLTPTPTKSPTPKKPTKSKDDEVQGAVILPSTKTLTIDQTIADYIRSKDWDYSTAIRIAKSENFWNFSKSFDCKRAGGVNFDGTTDHGLWQINDIHIRSGAITLEDALDCFKSTDFAYKLYKGRGNTFNAWSAFLNGSYLAHNEVIN